MWIIPSNHPLYSRFAPEYLASKEDLQELSGLSVSLPTWKSKPSSLQILSRAWKRVYWIPHLFGRTLKPSMHNLFAERYTASLAVIRVNRSQMRGNSLRSRTRATFGLISEGISKQLILFGASSKMLQPISNLDTELSNQIWKNLVTQLRKESLQRRKWARHIRERDCSSLHWQTPQSRDFKNPVGQNQDNLPKQLMKWPTPTAHQQSESLETYYLRAHRMKERHRGETGNGVGMSLNTAIKQWPTPCANEDSYRLNGNSQQSNSLSGLLRREVTSMNGKSRAQLNPAWVAQLMGTTSGRIFFAHSATAWLNKPQN